MCMVDKIFENKVSDLILSHESTSKENGLHINFRTHTQRCDNTQLKSDKTPKIYPKYHIKCI